MLLDSGLVMMTDSRTNAGVDSISTYRKLHIYDGGDDRIVAVATAGNLSVTQGALHLMAEGLPSHDEGGEPDTIWNAPTMYRVAHAFGRALKTAHDEVKASLAEAKVPSSASLLVGGRVGDKPLALYLVYSPGNFIECHSDSPFLQIGETKYGKPILVRSLDYYSTSLEVAVKLGLISMDSTIRSNLSVGAPIDMFVIPSDTARMPVHHRIEADEPYYRSVSDTWSERLIEAHNAIPNPPYF
jgi:putative proteasome-type protease